MPEYESANQQAADDASSISSWLSGSLWSLASSIISIAFSIIPNQRYDPLQQQPDDNSSVGSGEQDNQEAYALPDRPIYDSTLQQPDDYTSIDSGEQENHAISTARDVDTSERWLRSHTDVTSMTRQPELGVNDHQPRDNPSNTGIRTRRLLWWLRYPRVLLFSTTDSRRAKLVNWIILPLISVLYYLIFSTVTAHKGVTEGVLSTVCLVLITYHRIQAIRVLVPLSPSPQFVSFGQGHKLIFWFWVANHVVCFVVEVLLTIDYWVGHLIVIWAIVILCTVAEFYCFIIFGILSTLDNEELTLINFPIPSLADYFKISAMLLICPYVLFIFSS